MISVSRQEIYGKAKAGAVAGIVGGFALLISFFGIDASLSLPPGSFYMMIGLAVGLHDVSAVIFGGMIHMLTAATIGAVFCMCTIMHPLLNLRSIWKGIFAGGVTGLEVYAIFFVPITLYVMIPTIDSAAGSSFVSEQERLTVTVIQAHLDMIIWGALVLHVIYGAVMGFFVGMIVHDDYKVRKKSMLDLESESMPAT